MRVRNSQVGASHEPDASNDQCLMSQDEGSPNDQTRIGARSDWVLGASFVIGHLTFVIKVHGPHARLVCGGRGFP